MSHCHRGVILALLNCSHSDELLALVCGCVPKIGSLQLKLLAITILLPYYCLRSLCQCTNNTIALRQIKHSFLFQQRTANKNETKKAPSKQHPHQKISILLFVLENERSRISCYTPSCYHGRWFSNLVVAGACGGGVPRSPGGARRSSRRRWRNGKEILDLTMFSLVITRKKRSICLLSCCRP